VLCATNSEEIVEHLFLDCDLAKACWSLIGITNNDYSSPSQVFEDFRRQLSVPFFMEIIIIMSWSIWNLRNDEDLQGNLSAAPLGAKKKYFPHILSWLEQRLCDLLNFNFFVS